MTANCRRTDVPLRTVTTISRLRRSDFELATRRLAARLKWTSNVRVSPHASE